MIRPKGLPLKIYQKRKNEVQERRFFPERLMCRDVLVDAAIDDYLTRVRGASRPSRRNRELTRQLTPTPHRRRSRRRQAAKSPTYRVIRVSRAGIEPATLCLKDVQGRNAKVRTDVRNQRDFPTSRMVGARGRFCQFRPVPVSFVAQVTL